MSHNTFCCCHLLKKTDHIRCLKDSFDPEGKRIILVEDLGEPEILVCDTACLRWPEKLKLTLEDKKVGGSNMLVFVLRPSV